MLTTSSAFGMAVGGVGFQVQLPDDAWLAVLAPLYNEFPLDCEPEWQVTVSHDPDLDLGGQRWIEHDGPLTRFSVNGYGGWVDLERRQALVRTASLTLGSASLEGALAYACMQELPRTRHSLLLHAAGIHWQGRGLVVSGHAGAGKTTVARLAQGNAELFNDEMVIADLSGSQPKLLSTPFVGPTTPPELVRRINRRAPASALLLLAHASIFELQPLSPAEAVLELLRTNLAAVERTASATAWLAAVDRLVQALPAYQLRFRPTTELWDFLAGALLPLMEEPCAS